MSFDCADCGRNFLHEFNYQQHKKGNRCVSSKKKKRPSAIRYRTCQHCGAIFSSVYNKKRHEVNVHFSRASSLRYHCGICRKYFETVEEVRTHRKNEHATHNDFRLVESAHQEEMQKLRNFFPYYVRTMDATLFYSFQQLSSLIMAMQVRFVHFKLSPVLHVQMCKYDEEGNVDRMETFPFRCFPLSISRFDENYVAEVAKCVGDFERNVDEFLHQGSGWVVNRPDFLDVIVAACRPMSGGSCNLHVANWGRKVGPVVENFDEKTDDGGCFYEAVVAHFQVRREKDGKSEEEWREDFIKNRLVFLPGNDLYVDTKRIGEFEMLNCHLDLAIQVVYHDEEKRVVPIYASKNFNAKNSIVLKLFHAAVTNEKGEEQVFTHYALVPDPGQLFSIRNVKEGKVTNTWRGFICWNCHNRLWSRTAYERHVSFCHTNAAGRIVMPKKGEVRTYKDGEIGGVPKRMASAFSLFYDFEALSRVPDRVCSCPDYVLENTRWWEKKRKEELLLSCEELQERTLDRLMIQGEGTVAFDARVFEAEVKGRSPPKHHNIHNMHVTKEDKEEHARRKVCRHRTLIKKEQPPFAYTYVLVDREGNVLEDKSYIGDDCSENFIMSVLNLAEKYLPSLSPGVEMSTEEKNKGERARREVHVCYLCQERMSLDDRVLDHDHLTGKFLGVAHNVCNLNRREEKCLTCFAHNFSGYDSHFLIRALEKFPDQISSVSAIPNNQQKFKTMILNNNIKFLDSLAFLPDKLESLVEVLLKSNNPMTMMDNLVDTAEEKKLLLRKGVYPYTLATSIDALQRMKKLPPQTLFYNELTSGNCSDEDYAHAKAVWDTFQCTSMLDYTVLYCRSDVYQLAEAVMNFKKIIWDEFQLDMHDYLSLPHMAMDCMLKRTKAKIEMMSDQEMVDLVRKNIRGGHSFVNLRYAERKEEEEESDPRQSLVYLDVNNLYGRKVFSQPNLT